MIKGVLIFSAGVGVGYGVAMSNQEATAEFLRSMKAVVNDAWLDTKNEIAAAKKKAEQKEEAKSNDVAEESPTAAVDATPEVVEVDEVIDPDDTKDEQGETS